MRAHVLLTASAALALVACDKPIPAPDANAVAMNADANMTTTPANWTGFEPGFYVVTAADGSKNDFELKDDGTFTVTDAAGKVTTGTIAMKEGKGCFTPVGGTEKCWTNAAPGADGSWTATATDGETSNVMKKPA